MGLAVVIVNLDTRDLVVACLNSLALERQSLDAEVFVVDNASTDGSVEAVRTAHPWVHVIQNDRNLGFSRANNVALRRTTGRLVFLLNPDTELRAGAVQTLRAALDSLEDAVGVGPKVVRPDGRLDLACRRSFPSPGVALARLSGLSRLFPRARWFGRYNLTYADPDRPGEMDAGTAAAMMFRRDALAALDFFDEDYFMYGDDLDLCFRLKARGGRSYSVPGAVGVRSLRRGRLTRWGGKSPAAFHRFGSGAERRLPGETSA